MNLTTEGWVPIVWDNGKPGIVSLREVFQLGGQIRDLAARPHERIALMRLLICIAQAALDGPADYDDWKDCQPHVAPASLEYLDRWQYAFELFGDGQRFLQISELEKAAKNAANMDGETNMVSKLDLALATGNNATLFDNGGGENRIFESAQLAASLLSFQCFSPGGRIGLALWHEEETAGKRSSDHAPCLAGSMLHAIIRGEDLESTIHLNMLTKSQVADLFGDLHWGRPLWEAFPESQADTNNISNATSTYLGRLVPLARAVRLDHDCRTMILANGLKYMPYPAWREPTATVVVGKSKGNSNRNVVRASLQKAPWRELHSLTVKTISQNTNGGPLALQNIKGDHPFDLWVGGLVADQAKLVDTLESVFHVPAAMLTEPSQRAYEAGVSHAERTEFRLRRAISVYHKELGDDLDRAEMLERRQRIQYSATFQFWTSVERCVSDLISVAENPAQLGLDAAWYKTGWGGAVWEAALAAFEAGCPHETARQIRAYALGRKVFFAPTIVRELKEEAEA